MSNLELNMSQNPPQGRPYPGQGKSGDPHRLGLPNLRAIRGDGDGNKNKEAVK